MELEDLDDLNNADRLWDTAAAGNAFPRTTAHKQGQRPSVISSSTEVYSLPRQRQGHRPSVISLSPEVHPFYRQRQGQRPSVISTSTEVYSLSRLVGQISWVEKTFYKRECVKFIPSDLDCTRCACGRSEHWHVQTGVAIADSDSIETWHPYKHTEQRPTDAYGTIEFQGGPHPSKAQYIRLSSLDTRQENVLTLLIKHWGLDLPKLLITVHGGLLNFDLQPKLKRVFRKGLLKAARTTGAWIVTNGTNTGVTRHVGDAISDRTTKARNKVVAIGIAPWGIVENKEDLLGRDIVVPYHCVSSTKTNTSVLNSDHSYFLLADNGTVGKYGGEILFRKKFEKYIAQQKICIGNDFQGQGVPVICLVLEGGANTIRSVLEYVTDTPPVPVVVCDGSGRAADLLAFAHKYTTDDGTIPEFLRDQLILTIQRTFLYTQEQAEKLFIELMLCVKKKELITVFRIGDREESKDIDLAILMALLKGTTVNAIDQLNLTLTWDRVDIARSHIFVYGQEWPEGALEVAMMDALINDRVDFVKLLLENGVSMHTFLTITRLEDLYNSRQGPSNLLRYLVRDVGKNLQSNYRYTLLDIGSVLEHLMGGGFSAYYCRKRFRQKYQALKQTTPDTDFKGTTVGNIVTSIPHPQVEELFPYPFHELMIWAVLMKRQKMALFMWQHGEEAMAKALLAGKLYSAMAHEADQDDLEIELSEEFKVYSDEFLNLALELLEHCYKIDVDYTQQLLTYELKNFSEQTCLGLAVLANHRLFIAHSCCQVLLNDLWIGGLRMRKNPSLKVILGFVFPPYIFKLDFKSKEELQLMPQTMEEHLGELEDDISNLSFNENQDYNMQEDMVDPNSMTNQMSTIKENGTIVGIGSNQDGLDFTLFNQMPFHKKKSPLRMGKKVYEFYNAPVTKFWAHAIGYVLFLVLFFYVILDRIKEVPNWAEVYIMAFMLTMGLEKIRQIIVSEPVKVSMKLRVYFSQLWNILDTAGISLFIIGMVLRFIPGTLIDAQMIYSVDVILWNIRILEILSVNKYLGPYVKIIAKLLRDMGYFLTILFVPLTSFGLIRQTVNFQNEDVSWHIRLRNVWFYPYWMMYGELYVEEIDPCEEDEDDCSIYASWLSPFCMFVFCLVANILMVNLLIARFNATFIRNNANSKEIWMFQRYSLIMHYEMRPIIPPPFIIITHIYLALKYIKGRCKGKRNFHDNGLKLFLSHEDTEKLHDFEEECMEDLYRQKDLKHHSSIEERIKVISERFENMSMRLDDMNMKENHLRLSLGTLDHRISRIDSLEDRLYETIKVIKLLTNKDDGDSDDSQDYSHARHHRTYSSSSSMDGSNHHHPRSMSVGSADIFDRTHVASLPYHSRRKVLAEQLKSTARQRKLSGTDFPNEDIDKFVRENTKGTAASALVSDSGVQFIIGNSTLNRGGSMKLAGEERLKEIRASHQEEESTHKHKIKNFASQAVHFEPVVHSAVDSEVSFCATPSQPPIDVTAKLDSDTYTVAQLPEYSVSDGGSGDLGLMSEDMESSLPLDSSILNIASVVSNLPASITRSSRWSKVRSSLTGQPLHINTALAYAPFVPTSMPQSSACFVTQNPKVIPLPAVRDLSSMLNPLISEYTSITDAIDTSCIEDLSPPHSPAAASAMMFSDGYLDIDGKLKERPAANSKQMELKQAEELEHQRMEALIRHRLRQISQTERLKLMGQKWEHQRHSSGGSGRADSIRQETDLRKRNLRRSFGGSREGSGQSGRAVWARGLPKQQRVDGGQDGSDHESQNGQSERRSFRRNSPALSRSDANQNITAKPRYRRHSIALTIPLLNDEAILHPSTSLPTTPIAHFLGFHNEAVPSHPDMNVQAATVENSK